MLGRRDLSEGGKQAAADGGKSMKPDELDLSRVTPESYVDFKGTEEHLRQYLAERLTDIAAFFTGELQPDEGYEVWNTLALSGGKEYAFQFTEALRTANKLQAAYDQLVECGHPGKAFNNAPFLVLQYIAIVEAVERARYQSFEDWLISRIRMRDSDSVPSSTEHGELIRYLEAQARQYREQFGSAKAFRTALIEGLRPQEQAELLKSFYFTEPFLLGEKKGDYEHLYCRSKARDHFCWSACPDPTEEETRQFLPRLASRLYEMRSAFVHRGTASAFADLDSRAAGEFSTLYDVYFTSEGLIGYAVQQLRVRDLLTLLRKCMLRRIRSRASGEGSKS